MSPAITIADPRPYLRSILAVLAAWCIGVLACWTLFLSGALTVDGSLLAVVGVGSGLIAVASALPGVVLEHRVRFQVDPASTTVGFFVGVAIRLFGTVALAALCSYQLPAAKEQIAGATLVWYLYLTTVDVITLATLLPRLDRPAVTRSQNAKPSVQ